MAGFLQSPLKDHDDTGAREHSSHAYLADALPCPCASETYGSNAGGHIPAASESANLARNAHIRASLCSRRSGASPALSPGSTGPASRPGRTDEVPLTREHQGQRMDVDFHVAVFGKVAHKDAMTLDSSRLRLFDANSELDHELQPWKPTQRHRTVHVGETTHSARLTPPARLRNLLNTVRSTSPAPHRPLLASAHIS
jgi:hypothetical protein